MSHAIGMGGSVAGLCAAAALARNFDRVTVLERDGDPGIAGHKGVPQSYMGHILLRGGQDAMEELLPGTFAALAARGAKSLDFRRDFNWFFHGVKTPRRHHGTSFSLQSRPLLEDQLRVQLRALGKVEFRFGTAVVEPIHEQGRVVGVLLEQGERLDGDLVVDAMGRGSRSPRWLERWGCGEVPTQRVKLGLRYVSGTFEYPPELDSRELVGVYHLAPHNRRCGWVFPIEGNRASIICVGYPGDYPPLELSELIDWARGMLRPDIAKHLQRAELVGKLHTYNYKDQIRHLYNKVDMPSGYLVVGDAMCSVDPVLGQGMTLAAQQALMLTKLRPEDRTQRWQQRLILKTELPFAVTAMEGNRWDTTSGWDAPLGDFLRWYVGHVYTAASLDPQIDDVMAEVMHMRKPAYELFRPRVVGRVFRTLRRYRHAKALPKERSSITLLETGY